MKFCSELFKARLGDIVFGHCFRSYCKYRAKAIMWVLWRKIELEI
jgi:hypothetical protein